MADVPLPQGSQTIPVPQLPASNNSSSQWLNCSSLSNSLSNPFYSIVLHSTNWTELGWLCDIALEPTTQKTLLPSALLLLRAGCCLAMAAVSFVLGFLPSKGYLYDSTSHATCRHTSVRHPQTSLFVVFAPRNSPIGGKDHDVDSST
jgi:hypothetical protein